MPDPESLPDMSVAVEELKQQGAGPAAAVSCAYERPFEFRPAELPDPVG